MMELAHCMNLTLEEMYHHPHFMINAFDPDLRIIFWNRKCEEYFGVSKDDATGKRIDEVLPHLKGHEKVHYLHRALAGQPIIRNDRFEKHYRSYEQQLIPVKDSNGVVIAVLNIVKEVVR